jgi:hypothetical protein
MFDFITNPISSVVGGIEDVFGARNKFNATAPANTFQATEAPIDRTSYSQAIQDYLAAAGPNGANAAGQNALIGQLQTAANGGGPNPALEQLRETTNANAARTAGAIASQRGINPALAARMAMDAGANANQTAAGQAATLAAQQQIAARSQLAQALQAQAGLNLSGLTGTGNLQNGQNTGIIQNSLGTQGLNQATAAQNANLKLGAQQINAGVAAQNANTGAGLLGGIMQGLGAAVAPKAAHGGEITLEDALTKKYAAGGDISIPYVAIPDYSGPQYSRGEAALLAGGSAVGRWVGRPVPDSSEAFAFSPDVTAQPIGSPTVAPWEGARPLLTTGVPFAAHGGEFARAVAARGLHDFRVGGPVPGRPMVDSDSERNDVVPAMVSPGEVVLPRSVAQAPDAAQRAAEFVAAIKARREPEGYGRVLAGRREIARRRAELMAHGGEVKAKLGSGKRFSHLEHQLEGRGGVHDVGALAAYIGREKYGSHKMAQLSARGR